MCQNLVVTLHDVSPFFQEELEEIVRRLHAVGVDRMNLLVVPDWGLNYDGAYSLDRHPEFADWLKSLDCEFAQHGCHHKKPKGLRYKSGYDWLIGEQVAVGMAELQLPGYRQSLALLERGQEILQHKDVDILTLGCVPPWWQVNSASERAVRDSGFFDYYMVASAWNLFGRFSMVPITNLKTGEIHMSRELCFEPRSKFADYFTRFLAYVVTNCEQAETIRFGIHPPDIRNEEVFSYILDSIEKVRANRELKTYSELLAQVF
ncbi:DUF2334 domain-containing protein [Candidatus Woesearchaeota archaeon]|nr:DUF2334 domain-containing protein [Candidatus Woesearchaeota archaeon]MBW3016179.1 DUF2334 domain-containing protein [Candidatus Woesearchaeota archaeon]